jgi:hypothetical protein
MEYTSSRLKFSSYSNGITPHVGSDGYWYFGDQKTEHKASGVDGVSFDGVEELYCATLATNVDDSGVPIPPTFNKDNQSGWVSTMADSKFGTKNKDNIIFKYLWNVEKVKSKKGDASLEPTYTPVDLMDTYSGGRIPNEYISYYAADVDAIAPDL